MNSVICTAIAKRLRISFHYQGHPRIVDPYCHGISTAGNEVLRGYQVGGTSSSGNTLGWRLFETSQMSGLVLTSSSFSPTQPGYNPADKGMTTIHCRI